MSDCLQCCTQVMNETLTKSMSSAETSSVRYEPDRDKLVPAKDLIDAKKRMLATLKKKQAEFTKRVGLPPNPTSIFNACCSPVSMIGKPASLLHLYWFPAADT